MQKSSIDQVFIVENAFLHVIGKQLSSLESELNLSFYMFFHNKVHRF
jgi:hypothetical protein